MSRNNDVSKVLFLPEKAAKAAGSRVGALANGEWGVFNYDTGLTITATTITAATLPNNFFIAYVGDGTLGEAGEIYFSTGTHIQKRNLRYYTQNNPVTATGQVITVSGLEAQSGSGADNYDYGIKFDFRGNTELYQRFGMNQASKFATANTKCVGNGTASDDADAEVVAQWAKQIANDTDQFISFTVTGTGIGTSGGSGGSGTPGITFTASGNAGTVGAWTDNDAATANISITETEALAFIRAYATTSTDLSIAFTIDVFSSTYSFCNVNPKYFKQRGIKAIGSLVAENCTFGTITETTPMVYEEGAGNLI